MARFVNTSSRYQQTNLSLLSPLSPSRSNDTDVYQMKNLSYVSKEKGDFLYWMSTAKSKGGNTPISLRKKSTKTVFMVKNANI